MADSITALHVDDDPSFVEMAASLLERESDRLDEVTECRASDGLDRLADDEIDCIISDFDMPGMDGLAFLDAVREDRPGVPFILFTGKGSEEIASEAISRGVTDYMQKEAGTDQYAVLAKRVENAVSRYRTEQFVAEHQERFQMLVEESTDAIFVVDPAGTIQYATSATERLLGRPPGEVIGTDVFEPVHPDDLADVEAAFTDLLDQPEEERATEFRYRHADGSWIWVEARGRNLLETPAIDGIVVYIRNTTDRKRIEEELRSERRRFTSLFENAPDSIVCTRFEDGKPIVRDVNPMFEETFGYHVSEAVGECLDDLIVPEEKRDEADDINRRVLNRTLSTTEVRRQAADGPRDFLLRSIPVMDDVDPSLDFAVYTDITDRKERERRMQALHEATRRLVRATSPTEVAEITAEATADALHYPNNMVRLVDETGTYLDPAASSEGVGKSSDLGNRPRYAIDDSLAGQAFRKGEPVICDDLSELDDAYDHGDARSVIYLPIGEFGTLTIADTKPSAFDESDIRLARILTANATASFERVDHERTLRDREARLTEQNGRLEEFASVVSHDLRSPLEVIRGRAELLADGEENEHIDEIRNAARRMDDRIEKLLLLAREDESITETTTVDLSRIADECWRDIASDGASVNLDVAEGWKIEADRERLRQLLENVFRNAIDHGGDGVSVRIGAEGDKFYVEDDGPGIPESEREAVFETGFTTEAGGVGLGLSIVSEIVEAHGWEISVDEGPDGGARFEFTDVSRAD